MRITIRVKPGASRTRVGGSYDGALVVSVQERAVDGKATEAALRAVAEAVGCKRRAVSLISGGSRRTKVVELPDGCEEDVRALIDSGSEP